MTAYAQIATQTPRTHPNIKDRRPRSIDFAQFGFAYTDWNRLAYTHLDLTFHLAPSAAGLVAASPDLDDAETFPFGTAPGQIAQRLREIACQAHRPAKPPRC